MNRILLILLAQIYFFSSAQRSALDINKGFVLQSLANRAKVQNNNSGGNNWIDYKRSNQMGKRALFFTNKFRRKNGKKPLKWNQKIANIAKQHSIAMARNPSLLNPAHPGFKDRVNRFPAGRKAAGENLAGGTGRIPPRLPNFTVNGWINSPPHRKNLLGDFTDIGIGFHKTKDNRWYATQLFAKY